MIVVTICDQALCTLLIDYFTILLYLTRNRHCSAQLTIIIITIYYQYPWTVLIDYFRNIHSLGRGYSQPPHKMVAISKLHVNTNFPFDCVNGF